MNVFGQTIVQELPINENINIHISDYHPTENSEDKKIGSGDKQLY